MLAIYTGVLTVGQQPVVFKCEEESCMELRIEELNESELKEKRLDDLSFGVHFTDRMFVMEYDRGKGGTVLA